MFKFLLGFVIGAYIASQFPMETRQASDWLRVEGAAAMDRAAVALRKGG